MKWNIRSTNHLQLITPFQKQAHSKAETPEEWMIKEVAEISNLIAHMHCEMQNKQRSDCREIFHPQHIPTLNLLSKQFPSRCDFSGAWCSWAQWPAQVSRCDWNVEQNTTFCLQVSSPAIARRSRVRSQDTYSWATWAMGRPMGCHRPIFHSWQIHSHFFEPRSLSARQEFYHQDASMIFSYFILKEVLVQINWLGIQAFTLWSPASVSKGTGIKACAHLSLSSCLTMMFSIAN